MLVLGPKTIFNWSIPVATPNHEFIGCVILQVHVAYSMKLINHLSSYKLSADNQIQKAFPKIAINANMKRVQIIY